MSRGRAVATLVALLAASGCASAIRGPTGVVATAGGEPAEHMDLALRALLEDALDGDPHRGAAALFVDGDTESFASVGVRAHEGGTIDRSTVFPLGSISKTFAGLLLAESLRRGEIVDLRDPVTRVWKDKLALPRGTTREIDWDDLATHRSGLPFFPTNWSAGEEEHRAGYTMEEFRSYLAAAKLESEPGTKAVYGNTGFGLLALSLAELTGQRYSDLLRTRIFQPLGMTASDYPDRDERPPKNYVEGWGTGCQPQPWRWDPSPMGPCCVIRSSLTDMARLARALMQPNTIWSDDLARISEPRTKTPWDLGESFGLGVTVHPKRHLVWKDGQVEGVRSYFIVEPATRRALVLVASSYRMEVDDLAFRIWDRMTGDPSGELTTSALVAELPAEARAVTDARLAEDIVVEGVVAPLAAAPGETVTISLYLRCKAEQGNLARHHPYRVYSDLWMGAERGRILRTQRLADGAFCSEGQRFRHDVKYTLPPDQAGYRADLWVGVTGVDHTSDRPNATSEGKQRKRVARILVVDPASRSRSTWGPP